MVENVMLVDPDAGKGGTPTALARADSDSDDTNLFAAANSAAAAAQQQADVAYFGEASEEDWEKQRRLSSGVVCFRACLCSAHGVVHEARSSLLTVCSRSGS